MCEETSDTSNEALGPEGDAEQKPALYLHLCVIGALDGLFARCPDFAMLVQCEAYAIYSEYSEACYKHKVAEGGGSRLDTQLTQAVRDCVLDCTRYALDEKEVESLKIITENEDRLVGYLVTNGAHIYVHLDLVPQSVNYVNYNHTPYNIIQ